ncbi:MAG: PKD domain-containing protein [candidate division Zixibacteria bacterium]|nr:PKD domain-containing protein [candidate division Zixibacteria bacterium]
MYQRIAHDKAIARFDPLVRAESQRNSVPDKTAEGAKRRPTLRVNAALKLTLLFFLALVLPFAAVSLAQTGDITVQFNGGGADNKVYIGEENTLQIFITNADGPLFGISLGFSFTSAVPGFSWKTPYGNKPAGPKYIQEWGDAVGAMDGVLKFTYTSLPDMFLIGGAATPPGDGGLPLPAHAVSTLCWTLILIMPEGPGEYIDGFCIDNIFFPPAGSWRFDQGVGVGYYPPTFQGNGNTSTEIPDAPPVCFDIVYRNSFDIAFYGWPRRVDYNEPVFFTGMNTVSVDSWDWDFGDGTTHGTVQNPIHSYSSTGVYTVTLVATLTGGGTRIVVRTDYIHVNPVKADFTASPRYGSLDMNPTGLLVQFTDASTGSPTDWYWDFGDPSSGGDNISTLPSPTHTYGNPGVYTVQLTASNPGSSDTKIYLNCVRVDAVAMPDLQVSCYGPGRVRRGFHKELDIVVTNVGSADAIGGILTLNLSVLPTGVTFDGSVPPPKEPKPYPAMVTWDLPSITWDPTQYNFDDYLISADLYVDSLVDVGTGILTVASVSQVAGEVIVANNMCSDSEIVRAAIDPNDKSVQPPGCGSQRAIWGTERLNYVIQFENKPSATADAFYVLVVDTLDPNLDWGTLQLGPSSKDNVLTFDFDPVSGEMIWLFDGYELPPNVTPPEGEGYVSYSISPKPGLAEGALIKNLAHIRFDYESWLAAPATGPLQLSISNQDLNHNGIIDVCEFICGDANGDATVDISDVVSLIAYIFSGGPAPSPLLAGDANCDGGVDISDAVYLISYIFSGGPAPCTGC